MSTGIKKRPTEVVSTGRYRQKARTRRLLIETAVKLLAEGGQPSVTEVADAAEVSRRTAYRYFPTQEKLHAEAALEGLRPVMEAAIEQSASSIHGSDVERRLDLLVENMQRLAFKNESLLRTMIHQTVLDRTNVEEPRRGSRRVDWIEAAIKPLQIQLGAAAYARLVSALALCTGIEAILVLRDIRGLSANETTEVSLWMARAMLKQSLKERNAATRKRKKSH